MKAALDMLSAKLDMSAVKWTLRKDVQGQVSAHRVGPPGHVTYDKEGQATISLGGRRSAAPVQPPGVAGAFEEEEEETIGSGFIGPRMIPRFIQKIGIAKRAELLKLKGEEGDEE